MNFIKDNKLRVFYFIAIAVIFCVAYKYDNLILKDDENFNKFGYIGGVATIVGLIVTIFEVIHGIRISKSIRDEAREIVGRAKQIEYASFISECLLTLDESNDHLSGERYLVSLKCFQHFRRVYVRISSVDAIKGNITDLVKDVELALHQATHTSLQAPLPKNKRKKIQENIMLIKTSLEGVNPANRGTHVS